MATIISTKTSGVGGLSVTGDASGVLQLASADGTPALTINASQNVGIGIVPNTSLTPKLEIASAFSAPTAGSPYNGLLVESTDAQAGDKGGVISLGGLYDASNGVTRFAAIAGLKENSTSGQYGGYMAFYTRANGSSPAERMRIDSSGNLLVGTTSTTNISKLTSYNAGVAATFAVTSSSLLTTPVLQLSKADNNSTTSNAFVQFFMNGFVSGSGQINANGGAAVAFGSFSDARLKENITELPNQLANILALKPSEFDYKDGSGHQTGFIAQEMKEVYPDVVGEGADGMLIITGWSKTEARLVKSIQELKAIIDTQNARIEALEGVNQ